MTPPFTSAEFLDVFARYNQAVWPAQAFLVGIALLALTLVVGGWRLADRLVPLLLSILWAWTGVVYHWVFFRPINRLAKAFAVLFVTQSVLLMVLGVFQRRLLFRTSEPLARIVGWTLILFGLAVYPLLNLASGHNWPAMPTFGTPCPTTLFTLGLLLLTQPRGPRVVFAIPLLWGLVGTSAAVALGIREDFSLPVAALGTVIVLLKTHGKPCHAKQISPNADSESKRNSG